MMSAPEIGLIFDFDGLVADTESAIYQAWRELYAAEGEVLPLETYRQCVGSTFGAYDPMVELEKRLGRVPDWERLLRIKDEFITEAHQTLDTCAGVRELLGAANFANVRCAVASSSSPQHVHTWVDRLSLRDHFHHLTCRGDEGARAKPEPDLFLLAARRLGLPAEKCLVLEDSRNGLLAAHAAGMRCLVIPSPVTEGSDFQGARDIWPTLAGRDLTELTGLILP